MEKRPVRDSLEVVYAILKAITQTDKKTRIMELSNTGWSRYNKYLNVLRKNGYIFIKGNSVLLSPAEWN